MTAPVPRLWDLLDEAAEIDGARTLHLSAGKPPMVRIAEEGLRPLREDLPILTSAMIVIMLSPVVEPENWSRIEQLGEGEMLLSRGPGRRVTLTLFRSSEAWSAVVHF